ncbi:VOC family protein [Amycolatopsis acidiphila]|uniref:VOC family protein n=1 Tax=Amycolatopsis acidiphila TaxID=715473 RepID=A0A558ANW1_9PSEU|nr:VOC family protein [Amycolatopsis acidiphila]TVT25938.1 VOC family protein [Amycolatopsis acidiphila]UIJ63353.1 VOC family protein [Amycolatopsis acidiphila]GHG75145.1 glyoxalase [Amycolatopsis acidiphila]
MGKTYRMNERLALGAVELTVADLDRSLAYYTEDIGLRVLTRDADSAHLGVPGRTLAVVRERPGAVPPPASSPGLSHFAPQVPAPADLARFVTHYTSRYSGYQLTDHVVAHSCYVFDPDEHCVEVTCARPPDEWRWQNNHPVVVADPLDLRHFSDEPGADLPFDGLPAETTMGHVQLKVTDPELAATEPFYCGLLGFDVEGRLGTMFLAVGVTDQHALLVLTNRFSPDGGVPAPENSAHLLGVDLVLPAADDIRALAERLSTAGYPHELAAGVLKVRDPSGHLLRFTTSSI